MIYPNWLDSFNIPTVGDDIKIIKDTIITVSANSIFSNGVKIKVQPKSKDGVLSERARDIGILLTEVYDKTTKFISVNLSPPSPGNEVNKLEVEIKNILEIYRSTLDYVTHYIAELCSPKPPKVQFPIAKSGTKEEFSNNLDNWFPKLKIRCPNLKEYLLSIQYFSGYTWLRYLAVLSNITKHNKLLKLVVGNFKSLVVKYDSIGLRFGELGFKSCTIEEGGILKFLNSYSNRYSHLRGPISITINTKSLPTADPQIEIISEHRSLYEIKDGNILGERISIVALIWIIGKNVFRAIDTINNIIEHER
ncbi:MAG: hypothetical protein N2053_05925 [Chitinispirillaceae bacterium]|nr:hypothetical protein [Chitinispirillaceae bacterium]